jgi:hypothetical protein
LGEALIKGRSRIGILIMWCMIARWFICKLLRRHSRKSSEDGNMGMLR